jgi:DNA-binding transcriptional LysR family regulator
MSDWENYHTFLETLREGSFARAARKMGLTHPTIRRRIEDLERSLGVTLFTRTADGLCPTDAARRFQGQAEAMEAAAQNFLRIAAGEAGVAAGVVRIACSEITAQELLPRVIRQLRARHAGLRLQIDIGNEALAVLRGEADIAIQLGQPHQKALVGRRVGITHIGLFAHPRHLAAAGAPSRVADLKRFSLIGAETDLYWKLVMRTHGLDLDSSDFAFRVSGQVAQLAAMRAGVGIGLIHTAIAARRPVLTRLLADEIDLELDPWVVTHDDLRHEPRIRVVIDAIIEQLAAYTARQPEA